MAASISEQLQELLNPLPAFADPEDEQDEEPNVIDKFDEGDDYDDLPSGLRKHTAPLLADTDKRYRGKAVSRKELLDEIEGSDEEEEDEEDIENEESEDEEDDDDDDDEEKDEEEEDLNEDDSSQMSSLVSKMKSTDLTLPKEMDFRKLTEGMDDLGESEDEEQDEMEDGESEEGEDDDEEEDGKDEDKSGAVMTFSKVKVNEEVEKGRAVKKQLALWDLLLEGRIKMQKALVMANQLPQPDVFPEFRSKGGADYTGALKNSHKALKALQRSLLELQDLLLYQNPETRAISQGKAREDKSQAEDEEVHSDEDEIEEDNDEEERPKRRSRHPKRKLEMADYPDFMAKRFAAFQPYRDTTLQKWYDKTRLTMGKTNKGFGAFERNILTQVEQVLMDKERLLRRTQTRRADYRVLGKPELVAPSTQPNTVDPEAAELPLKANAHLKDLDEEIFDDDDFYHQLLRELIERKTSAADPNDQVAMGRQWLAIQKLRSKIKKKVDTKASKGRKVRFHIHSKLVNFMAPLDHSTMSDEARSELYRSLFGTQMVH